MHLRNFVSDALRRDRGIEIFEQRLGAGKIWKDCHRNLRT